MLSSNVLRLDLRVNISANVPYKTYKLLYIAVHEGFGTWGRVLHVVQWKKYIDRIGLIPCRMISQELQETGYYIYHKYLDPLNSHHIYPYAFAQVNFTTYSSI